MTKKDTSGPFNLDACVLVANIPLDKNEESFWEFLRIDRDPLTVARRMIADPRGLLCQSAIIEYATIKLAEYARNRFRIKFRSQPIEACCASEFLEWYSTFLTSKDISVDVSLLYLVEVDCLAPSISDEDIEKNFSPYGKVSNITKKSPPSDESVSRITFEMEGFLGGLKAELALDNSKISGSKVSVRTAVNLARIRSIIRHKGENSVGGISPIVPNSELQYPRVPFFNEVSTFEKLEREDGMEASGANSTSFFNPRLADLGGNLLGRDNGNYEPAKDEESELSQDDSHLACEVAESSDAASGDSLVPEAFHLSIERPAGGAVQEAGLARAPSPRNESNLLPDAIVVTDYGMPNKVPFRGFNPPADTEPTSLAQGTAALIKLLGSVIPEFEEPVVVPDPVDEELVFKRIPDVLKWIIFREFWES